VYTRKKRRPLAVVVVSVLFILAGAIGFAYHFSEFFDKKVEMDELLWVQLVRIIAIVCGFFLLKSKDWARWLAIAWLLYHVLIAALHSRTQMITHIVILLVVAILLYIPKSSDFFQQK
jgi:hypothetical protein